MLENVNNPEVPNHEAPGIESNIDFKFDPEGLDSYTDVVKKFVEQIEARTGLRLSDLPNREQREQVMANQLGTEDKGTVHLVDDLLTRNGLIGFIDDIVAYTGDTPKSSNWQVAGGRVQRTERVQTGKLVPTLWADHNVREEMSIPVGETLSLKFEKITPFPGGRTEELFVLVIKLATDTNNQIVGGSINFKNQVYNPSMRGFESTSKFALGNHWPGAPSTPRFNIEGRDSLSQPRSRVQLEIDKLTEAFRERFLYNSRSLLAQRPAFMRATLGNLGRRIAGIHASQRFDTPTEALFEKQERLRHAGEVNNILNQTLDFIPGRGQFKKVATEKTNSQVAEQPPLIV